MASSKEIIAKRVALEMKDGDIVNLGIGLPTMVPNFLPEGVSVTLHSENGFVGLGPAANGNSDRDFISPFAPRSPRPPWKSRLTRNCAGGPVAPAKPRTRRVRHP